MPSFVAHSCISKWVLQGDWKFTYELWSLMWLMYLGKQKHSLIA